MSNRRSLAVAAATTVAAALALAPVAGAVTYPPPDFPTGSGAQKPKGPFKTLKVCKNKKSCFPTIQSAVNKAKPGDTVKVANGTYKEAVKISGAMFTMFRKQGATLSRALCQLPLDRNSDAFEEVRPPSLVLSSTLTATGQLPKFADDAYHLERDDLWCIPTAEVPLTSIAKDEILAEADLPTRLMAYSPCFRREAGSAGRDTRGLLASAQRQHERDDLVA